MIVRIITITKMTEEEPKAKKNYRRDKPWDNEDIDHWKVEVNISLPPR